MTRAQEMEKLQHRISEAVRNHKSTSVLTAQLCALKARQLNEENAMTDAITAERKIHDIEVAVDDLTSLAQTPGGAKALASSNLEGIERRLRHLRFDLQALQAAE